MMDKLITDVCALVRKSDWDGLRTVLEGLVMTGVQNRPLSERLMATKMESGEDRIARKRKEYDDDDGA